MWARNGALFMVDLGQDYYLVTFTCEEDQYAAVMEGHGSSMIITCLSENGAQTFVQKMTQWRK